MICVSHSWLVLLRFYMCRVQDKVFTTLEHKLLKLDAEKHKRNLLTNDSHFTRTSRKLTFKDDMEILIFSGASSLSKELYKYFNYDINTVSVPGFIKSRKKIKEEAFIELMKMVNKAYPCRKKYKGYRLLAVDGTNVSIASDENDIDNKNPCAPSSKGAWMFHTNALYDLMNHRYIDNIIQSLKNMNEVKAMWTMVERYKGDKAIFIADRNYATWNNMEHIIKSGHYFLIRSKDIHSGTSILKKFNLPDKEFDLDVETILTKKSSKETINKPHKYRLLSNTSTFDYINSNNPFYHVKYRVVRVRLDTSDKYESIITNLPCDSFPPNIIKELYKLRWDIEVSYKHLKYSVNLNALHSKKREFIRQEIWAKLIMFNMSMIIIDELHKKKLSKRARKWEYRINISMAIHLIKQYSLGIRKGGIPPNYEDLILKQILPVRPNRNYPRNVRPQGYVVFGYRST